MVLGFVQKSLNHNRKKSFLFFVVCSFCSLLLYHNQCLLSIPSFWKIIFFLSFSFVHFSLPLKIALRQQRYLGKEKTRPIINLKFNLIYFSLSFGSFLSLCKSENQKKIFVFVFLSCIVPFSFGWCRFLLTQKPPSLTPKRKSKSKRKSVKFEFEFCVWSWNRFWVHFLIKFNLYFVLLYQSHISWPWISCHWFVNWI